MADAGRGVERGIVGGEEDLFAGGDEDQVELGVFGNGSRALGQEFELGEEAFAYPSGAFEALVSLMEG